MLDVNFINYRSNDSKDLPTKGNCSLNDAGLRILRTLVSPFFTCSLLWCSILTNSSNTLSYLSLSCTLPSPSIPHAPSQLLKPCPFLHPAPSLLHPLSLHLPKLPKPCHASCLITPNSAIHYILWSVEIRRNGNITGCGPSNLTSKGNVSWTGPLEYICSTSCKNTYEWIFPCLIFLEDFLIYEVVYLAFPAPINQSDMTNNLMGDLWLSPPFQSLR